MLSKTNVAGQEMSSPLGVTTCYAGGGYQSKMFIHAALIEEMIVSVGTCWY